MGKKLAIVYCVHHKPWLIMSTLITTLIQNFNNFDIFFIYQQGNGADIDNMNGGYFKEYNDLSAKYGINQQLDPYDLRVVDVCKINGVNITELFFNNDQGLDSGAWYKFIKMRLWQKYDYAMFLGEGALLTQDTVLNDTLNFAQKNNIHFITNSHEKRRIPKSRVFNGFASSKKSSEMTVFHDKMIRETFNIFSRDADFRKRLESWPSDFNTQQQHHVPDIWGYKGLWMKIVNIFYPNISVNNSFAKNRLRKIVSCLNYWFSLWLKVESKMHIYIRGVRRGQINSREKTVDDYIYVNGARKRLSDVGDCKKEGLVNFHKSDGIEWFGVGGSHFVSREFLEKFSSKLEQHKMYDVLGLPFSATALEIIWAFIPQWLGYDKWFFNGIHRVRKNFVSYRREDNPQGLVRYINRYYRGKISVDCRDDFIKLSKLSNKFGYLKNSLNSFYF